MTFRELARFVYQSALQRKMLATAAGTGFELDGDAAGRHDVDPAARSDADKIARTAVERIPPGMALDAVKGHVGRGRARSAPARTGVKAQWAAGCIGALMTGFKVVSPWFGRQDTVHDQRP